LAHLPRLSIGILQVLLDGLDHREPDIRWAIGLLLVRLAKTEKTVVHSLSELCASGSAAQKRMAIYCLRDLNLNDARSLKAIMESLCDSDATVRVAASIALRGRSDMDANHRRTLLELFVRDPDSRVRNAAAITLSFLGSPSEEFLTALKEASESDNPQLKKVAGSALAIIENKKVRPNR
jgi:HEAT repeat protein